jgi:hypothetical protein
MALPARIVEEIGLMPEVDGFYEIENLNEYYLLISNLQKAIRRGLVDRVDEVATRLACTKIVQNAYYRLFRRMMVILMEDVGRANYPLLHAVRSLKESPGYYKNLEIVRAVARLAAISPKSWEGCGLWCQGIAAPAPSELRPLRVWKGDLPIHQKVEALTRIHQQGPKQKAYDLMLAHGADAELVETIEHFTQWAHGEYHSFSFVFLPELGKEEAIRYRKNPFKSRQVNGIDMFAVDMHTRPGKSILTTVLRKTPELRRAKVTSKLLGLTIFRLEGVAMEALVPDLHKSTKGWYHAEVERSTTPLSAPELLSMVKGRMKSVNRLRKEALLAL